MVSFIKSICRHVVCEEMNAKIGGPAVGSMHGDTIAIFGHAVFINSVASTVVKEWGISNADDILDYDLGEADAILIDKRANLATYLTAI